MSKEKATEKKQKQKKPEKTSQHTKKDKVKKSKSSAAEPSSKSTSLLADQKNVDAGLSSLFAVKPIAKSSSTQLSTSQSTEQPTAALNKSRAAELVSLPDTLVTPLPRDVDIESETESRPARKRKRADQDDDLEDKYMRKLAREEAQEAQRNGTHLKNGQLPDRKQLGAVTEYAADPVSEHDSAEETQDEERDGVDGKSETSADSFVPPKHETQTAASDELDKANRTVFLGNIAVLAITSKPARKSLEQHLMSFSKDHSSKSGDTSSTNKRILESIRFRSTPYSPSLPKKAAFARKEVVTATTQSTNAYAVYTTPAYAREAVRHLNGTVILDRHLRVDSVAHPTPIEHRRCVFVGNLGFVDDESNINAANEADGREKRKTKQKPSDVEEGLWRLFGKHGTVESVRVVRDKGTRVGKGIAYVQFTDEIAVDGALSEDGKKDPPMLPRRLRVTRAKAMRKKPAAMDRTDGKENATGYRRKVTPGEASQKGRIGKLMGKAAAAMTTKNSSFRAPESFVFEGHRARATQGKAGLKLGKTGIKRKGKPTTRSARRAASFKAGQSKK